MMVFMKGGLFMLWWILLLLMALILLIPVQIRTDGLRAERRVMRVTVSAAGWKRTWQIESHPGPDGRTVEITGEGGTTRRMQPDPRHGQRLMRFAQALRHAPMARRFLTAHVHPLQLDAQWLFHASSAASTALATGGLRMALSLLPRRWLRVARIRILPDFLRDHSTLQWRCIFRLRPGTLLLTAGLLALQCAGRALKMEAERLWNIPSEN